MARERKAASRGLAALDRDVDFFRDVLAGTADAPWLWWAVALVVILLLLLGGLRLLGLFPE